MPPPLVKETHYFFDRQETFSNMIRVKFINDAATVSYKPEANMLEIIFDGTGNYEQHQKTLNIAKDLADIYRCSAYFLTYRCFTKISPASFSHLLLRWMHALAEPVSKASPSAMNIYLVVAQDALRACSKYFSDEGLLSYGKVVCYLFETPEEVQNFLDLKKLT